MGNNKDIRIVLSTLRYKSSPEVSYTLQVPFVQTVKELIGFERNINISLAQVFDDERQKSTIFRPTAKFTLIFKNSYTGTTSYTPFENNLYYVNASETAKLSCEKGENNVDWGGFPQYDEFDFVRGDYKSIGYTKPPNNHINFVTKSASTYNWNFFLSYAHKNNYNKDLSYYNLVTQNYVTWKSGQGIPFLITNLSDSGNNIVSFKCPIKHGLSVGEYVELSFSYNGDKYFQVYSLGDGTVDSDSYVFNIFNYGFIGTVFDDNTTGTFKRVLDIDNPTDTTSEYYVREMKMLSDVPDYNMVNAGFEQNIFGKVKKYESEGFTPNKVARVSLKEGSQTYTLSFNKDYDINGLLDNQKRPISELFFTVIWKGFFGWTFNFNSKLKQGYNFNLPLIPPNKTPNVWWKTTDSRSNVNVGSVVVTKNDPKTNKPFNFTHVKSLKSGDVIDGDLCEWNNYEQNERVLSKIYHKFTFNEAVFRIGKPTSPNQLGYYYQPHNSLKIRQYSDYVEDGDADTIANIPNYAYFSTNKNSFTWRDLYTYGFKDPNGNGVDYPFTNGRHYPFGDYVFRIMPEGTNNSINDDDTLRDQIKDNCE